MKITFKRPAIGCAAAVAALSGTLITSAAFAGEPCNSQWLHAIGQPGMSGTGFTQALALAEYDGSLIVGGNFNAAGGVPASHIARWTGSPDDAGSGTWQPMGAGFSNPVNALTVYNGELIASGQFTSSGGTPLNRIARWDEASQTWQPLGAGMNNGVFALTVYNGELIAAGIFTTAGGVSANRIARWNGSAWQPLGSGVNEIVEVVYAWYDDLVVGGKFTLAGGVAVSCIAKWNGTSWQSLGGGMNGPPPGQLGVTPDVRSLIDYNGDLIAGGQYFNADFVEGTGSIARWDGTEWHALGGGVSAPFGPGTVMDLAIVNGDLIAAGSFITAGGITMNRVARWDGEAWHVMGEQCPNSVAAGCGMNDNIVAILPHKDHLAVAGNFTQAFGSSASRITFWDGCVEPDPPTCVGDVTGSGSVGVADLLELLSCWGPAQFGTPCSAADLNGDRVVGVPDLLLLLAAWGPCP